MINRTYAQDSNATLLRKLSDPYVKAFRFATDRISDEGVIAFVTNSSFISDVSFDGMRMHLGRDFDAIYVLDLGGNVRKNPKLSGTTHNVFGIQVGVCITILIRRNKKNKSDVRHAKIVYASTDEFWKKEEKYSFLEKKRAVENIKWRKITPDASNNWLNEGSSDFDDLVAIGSKDKKAGKTGAEDAIFKVFSLGVSTNRDSVVYDFSKVSLEKRVKKFEEDYNNEVSRFSRINDKEKVDIDNFVKYSEIKWSRNLKRHFRNCDIFEFKSSFIRNSIYRPFTKQSLCFSDIIVDEPGSNLKIFPTPEKEFENHIICVNQTSERPFCALISNVIPNLVMCGGFGAATQCFPFYTYSQDGSNRKENITDWSLTEFRTHYKSPKISKWDIFHYVYAILHHPAYRTKYAANLRRSLPRIPYAPDFGGFAKAGKKLVDLHINYETQPEYKLNFIENPKAKLNWNVEKMKLSKDKTTLIYNDFLTLKGIPKEVFDYRLGNRSALDWIIDQYQVSTDKRSGIVNNPNNPDDQQYIVKLIGKVITVSVETVRIVKSLPEIE
jgi:predicted helicase